MPQHCRRALPPASLLLGRHAIQRVDDAEAANPLSQAGKLAPSVEDILHLEKRWNKLPGASAGSVSLQDATTLLGAEVLEVSRREHPAKPRCRRGVLHKACLLGGCAAAASIAMGAVTPHPAPSSLKLANSSCNLPGACLLPSAQGEPLEFVVRQVFGGAAAPPPVLSKRQFLSLAHVAEVAQGKAFDLVTAEDALRAQEPPASHRKRPPTIRDAHIDTWHIAAGRGGAEHTAAAPQYEAAAAAVLATAAPGPLESHLSRADSLALPAGPLEQGVQALSRHNSSDGLAEMAAAGGEALEEEEAAEEEPDHAAVAAARLQHQSGATSYQSIEEMASAAEEEGEVEEGREGLDAADEFATKLTVSRWVGELLRMLGSMHVAHAASSRQAAAPTSSPAARPFSISCHQHPSLSILPQGLMRAVSGDVGRAHPEAPPHTPEGLLPADDSAAAVTAGGGEVRSPGCPAVLAPASKPSAAAWHLATPHTHAAPSLPWPLQAPAAGKARSSWESFNSTPGSAGAAAAAQQASLAAAAAHTPPQQQQMNEAVISAAMAAGMTFMQHLQAAGTAGAPAPSPFSDVNPMRHAAAAAAAMAANPGMGAPQLSRAASFVPPSPDVHPSGAQRPQQVIAEMMAHLNLRDASPAQLQAAATTLQQQAMAMQQQHHHHQPAASRQGSMGSSAASGDAAHHHTGQQHSARSEGVRRSWRAFEGEQAQLQAQLQAQQQEAGRLVRRQRAAAAVTVDVQPPRASGIAGWEPMSGDDVHRCRSIFAKKVGVLVPFS